MRFQPLLLLLLLSALPLLAVVESNSEGDALNEWKIQLTDPYNVLQSWDPTLSNPCTWFHISCNSNNSVTRVDLGSAGLSGILIPQLATLTNLRFLEVSNNNISGSIPYEFGNLKNLVSLGLNRNKLNGSIPESLGNLRSLRYMSLSSNKLSGRIPIQVIQLVFWGNLRVMNVSDNQLAGSGHHMHTTRTGVAVTTIIQDAKA